MKKNMNIAAVKLIDGGLKGIEVKYAYTSIKNNRSFTDEVKEKKKAPIHHELDECFAWLKEHLLNICGYTVEANERKYLMEQLTVTAVDYTAKGFVLEGSLSILDGSKFLSLKTPVVESLEQYPEFGDVLKIINGVFSETKEYMEGKKMMTDEQIVLRFAKTQKDFDMDTIAGMSKEETKEWATKFLEQKCKSTVFHHEDLEEVTEEMQMEIKTELVEAVIPEPEVSETPKMEVVKEEVAVSETLPNPVADDLPGVDPFEFSLGIPADTTTEKIAKGKKLAAAAKTEVVPTDAVADDDFSLNIPAPIKKESTAKRKTA